MPYDQKAESKFGRIAAENAREFCNRWLPHIPEHLRAEFSKDVFNEWKNMTLFARDELEECLPPHKRRFVSGKRS